MIPPFVILGCGPRGTSGTLSAIYVGEAATIGHYNDGQIAEIFLNADKGRSAVDDAMCDSAVVASIAIRHVVRADTLRRALMRNGSGVASGHERSTAHRIPQ